MARIIKTIEIEGQPAVAMFDTGARFTYVADRFLGRSEEAGGGTIPGSAGRQKHRGSGAMPVGGRIEGLAFDTDGVPVEELGHADGRELDLLIGAPTMERLDNSMGQN